MSYIRFGIFLKVVRREPMVAGGNKIFKEAPRPASNETQISNFGGRNWLQIREARRLADPKRKDRRAGPQYCKRQRNRRRMRHSESDDCNRRHTKKHTPGHLFKNSGYFQVR